MTQYRLHTNQSGTGVLYFPYGKASFQSIREKKQFYIDKTHFIPTLEKYEQSFLVRPPRWGKSLMISMLSAYYDTLYKDQFDKLFDGLWIHRNPTPLRNEYCVLHLDISFKVSGSVSNSIQDLESKINEAIDSFKYNYELDDIRIDSTNALVSFDRLVSSCVRNKLKLMVFIDEYDRFVNKLMFEQDGKLKHVDELTLFLYSFFERLKRASTANLKDFRSLIVGITPIAFSNRIGHNISQTKYFGDLLGFTEDDLRLALGNIGILAGDQEDTLMTMKQYYNGYRFPGSTQSLFNPTHSLFFLNNLVENPSFKSKVLTGNIPITEMKDSNVSIGNMFGFLTRNSVSYNIIKQVLAHETIEVNQTILSSFKLDEILEMPSSIESTKKWDRTVSLMYYLGMLTNCEDNGTNTLVIPNQVLREEYVEELDKIIKLSPDDILNLYKFPSAEHLKQVLTKTIANAKYSQFNNSFSELELQHFIYNTLKAYFKYHFPHFKVSIENANSEVSSPITPHSIILESECDVIMIHLKRIKPNEIVWNRELLNNLFKLLARTLSKKEKERTINDALNNEFLFESTIERINEGLSISNHNELLDLPIKLQNTTCQTTIRNYIHHEQKQFETLPPNPIHSKLNKTIHTFLAVQLSPILVHPMTTSFSILNLEPYKFIKL